MLCRCEQTRQPQLYRLQTSTLKIPVHIERNSVLLVVPPLTFLLLHCGQDPLLSVQLLACRTSLLVLVSYFVLLPRSCIIIIFFLLLLLLLLLPLLLLPVLLRPFRHLC